MTDIPGDNTTTSQIDIGGTFNGSIETDGDHDWVAVTLVAGQKYTFTLDGSGANPLGDPYLYLHDSAGNVLAEDDDGDGNHGSRIVFTATTSGTYYLDASSYTDGTNYTQGDYQLTAQIFTPPPVYSYAQISDQLVNGYWSGDWHSFNVTQGGSITVNITGLTAAGQTLARAALAEWSDVIGVTFKEVTGVGSDGQPNGQIVFDDSDDGAYTSSVWSNHVISKSDVNISTQWINTYGITLNSYSFQTYVHEIGHALGLGHGGNYNDTATYPDDALYSNDAWSTTVMSYFSQQDSSYFASQGFTEDYALTPMIADIRAMQTLYGLSTTTRVGDTVYGYGNTSGNPVFDTAANPTAAYTIIDSGGTDTLNYANSSADQLINLNPETFSNVAGNVGNVSIALGTVIENANGGSGNDTIVGNAANNVLNGNAGNDTVSYEAATAGVTVDLRATTQQNTVGAGRDTLSNFENLIGSSYADVLTGRGSGTVNGGEGNDVIHGASGGDQLLGGNGDDVFIPGTGHDTIDGGAGWDTVDFSAATKAVTVDLSNAETNSYATYQSVEAAIGSNFADHLTGDDNANSLSGGAGVDVLRGNGGNDTLNGGAGLDKMYGGTGDDTYYVDAYGDSVVENAGEGTDQVFSSDNYKLSANVENLTLTGSSTIWGYGNGLDNSLMGNGAANKLYALDGNDTLNGGGGADIMFGGTGNDTYYVDNYGDRTIEKAGEGTDSVFATTSYRIGNYIENATLTGTSDIWVYGNSSDNVLTGNSGANKLYGLGGNDTLIGGAGNDLLQGGAGRDVMTGGDGKDSFVFATGDFGGATPIGADEITDFTHGQDHIRLNLVDANTTVSGDQAFTWLGTGAFDGHAGELRYDQIGGNTYVSGDTNGDGIADFMIMVDGLHALVSNDFAL